MAKSEDAFWTISELATELGVGQHVLRYWEGRFPQLRPLQRAGNRRYYRPADVALARRIDQLLNHQGYTVKGVQKLLDGEAGGAAPSPADDADPQLPGSGPGGVDRDALRRVRDALVLALAEDDAFR
jgi:DNA-binding transcriptional MerR regulator